MQLFIILILDIYILWKLLNVKLFYSHLSQVIYCLRPLDFTTENLLINTKGVVVEKWREAWKQENKLSQGGEEYEMVF